MKKLLPFDASTWTDEVQSSSRVDDLWLLTRREFVLGTIAGAVAVAGAPLFTFGEGATAKPVGSDISELSKAAGKLLESSPYNLVPDTKTKVFDAPVFGVSSAQDALYEKLKEVVGKDHYLPEDLLTGAKSVISYFLPYSDDVSKANRGKDDAPDLWVKAHKQGAKAEELVRRFLEKKLAADNIAVFVPFHDKRYRNKSLVSNWSERHVAYISGLGTFGLHKNLITEKGSSGRVCSLITDHDFTATKLAYKDVYDYCTKCQSCVGRCPVGAIKKDGKDIRVCCKRVLAGKATPETAICGKCLTGVPCENCIPHAKEAQTRPA
jgi:epoxyqueuosine reductase QueG